MNKKKTYFVVLAAIIAAIYAGLTYISAIVGIAYGSIQFRFSEALTVLPVFTPAAIPGLTIGCLISNLTSPYGIVDILCGTFATFSATTLSYLTRKIKFKDLPLLSALFPVITNAVIVGLEITLLMPEGFKFTAFLLSACQIALGETVVSFGLGLPLYKTLRKIKADRFF